MATKIRVLNDLTINKIAAGEVIENPSSVVKELVENAIDAGATNICIEISGGGRQLIRISDNGSGMGPDDALLCLERHATSKIRDVEDIHELMSMGFRGEAVPSIASISKFTLLTCPQEENGKGTMILVDGGKIISCSPAVRSPGTTIEVKSLFFNVPVRKKFQKSPNHDSNEILKMVSLLALGHPDIHFELISDQKTALNTMPASDTTFETLLAARIESILGADFLSLLLSVSITKGDCAVTGFVGVPSHHRQNRTGQYLFINKRGVVSPLVSFAVREGYGPTLPPQRHPIFVLHLTIPGTLVDVNVHPQKREVRLRQEHLIKDLLKQAVQQALQKSPPSSAPAASMPWDDFPEQTPFEPFATTQPQFTVPISDEHIPSFIPSAPPPTPKQQELFIPPEKPSRAIPRVIATMNRYILVEASSGLSLIDQTAAHRRILYEKIMQRLACSDTHQKEIQQLLIPITIDLPNLEAGLMRSHLETLQQMGFGIREFGPQTFVIDAIPPYFSYADLSNALLDILHDIDRREDSQHLEREREKQIAMAASRASIESNKRLTHEEAQKLVYQLLECDLPFQCPQGNPTIVHLDQEDLAHFLNNKARRSNN